ncbi:microtubule-destabilizing protein 60-like [Argentina anserina]|uniref:microtubule-destabilizing protein 60-like n=1 Tax=Argentina anserina TaxID=57926 RepID=UPI0021766599|nr:microtubule-destabilizing protein 60-like [Potentilla anserina]
MDSAGKSAVTPIKDQHGSKSKKQDNSRHSENLNPNVSPGPRSANKSKSASKNPIQNPVFQSPRKKIRERKFVVAKKRAKEEDPNPNPNPNTECGKCKAKKCLCLAYESLRASQEEFFKTRPETESGSKEADREIEAALLIQDRDFDDRGPGEADTAEETGPGCSTVKRRRARLLEEARQSVPERGKVLHLVQAFEKLLTIPKKEEEEEAEEEEEESGKKATKWALPGLQPPQAHEFCPSDLFLTSENLGLDRRPSVSSSWDGSMGSISNRTSNGGRRSRRNSSESSSMIGGSRWKKKQQLRATSLKPFKLRTEERGRMKGEEFMKKVQEMMVQEERQRIPIAQGLPWTTDEPECLVKPPVKESTIPSDPKLHTDVRAVERAEFDHQVAEKLSLFEQYKMERERLQKLAEEDEVRRLRKELVPKAQPMPYFDRPFIPRRSMKHPTIPKDPKFHIPQHKKIKCCMSWNDDMSSYSYQSEA